MSLKRHRLAILAPYAAQAIANLAHGSERFNTIKDARQDVFSSLGRFLEFPERSFHGSGVAPDPERMQSFHLVLFNRGIDAERLDGALFFIQKPFHADNDCFVSLDFFLLFISRVLDPALNKTRLNRVQRAADSVNLVEVVDHAL